MTENESIFDLNLDSTSLTAEVVVPRNEEMVTWKERWRTILTGHQHRQIRRVWTYLVHSLLIIALIVSSIGPSSVLKSLESSVITESTVIEMQTSIDDSIAATIDSAKCKIYKEQDKAECPSAPVCACEYAAHVAPTVDDAIIQSINSTFNRVAENHEKMNSQLKTITSTIDSAVLILSGAETKLHSMRNDQVSMFQRQDDIFTNVNQLRPSITTVESSLSQYALDLDSLKHEIESLKNRKQDMPDDRHQELMERAAEVLTGIHAAMGKLDTIEQLCETKAEALMQRHDEIANTCSEDNIRSVVTRSFQQLESSSSRARQNNVLEKEFNYSKLVNYASRENGAKIVKTLTSRTFYPDEVFAKPKELLKPLKFIAASSVQETIRSIYDLFHLDAGVGNPYDAISDDMTVGSCWPLEVSCTFIS